MTGASKAGGTALNSAAGAPWPEESPAEHGAAERAEEAEEADVPVRRRADARRNIEAIVEAGIRCFRSDPQASMAVVAHEAGVSRVTLYAHFPSKEALLNAVLEQSLSRAVTALESDQLDRGPADEALGRLLCSSWTTLQQHASLVEAAARVLDEETGRRHRDKVHAPVEAVIVRGQAEGTLRTDLPVGWMMTTLHSLLHAAVDQTQTGQMTAEESQAALVSTLLPALRPPRPAEA